MTMPPDLLAHNKQLIIQFRADGGASMGNRPLLLLTTLGRRSGQKRTSPMMYVRSDDDRVLVIASNNGAPADPLWYRNLIADPHVTVELPGQEFAATAEPLTGADYDREWARIKEKFPFFADHELRSAGRQIPVVALNRAG
jgi:deazaflavin-dependent oxidoreductase (nitroreductase family)